MKLLFFVGMRGANAGLLMPGIFPIKKRKLAQSALETYFLSNKFYKVFLIG